MFWRKEITALGNKDLKAEWGFTAKRLLNLVLPPQCLACDTIVADQGGLCASCWNEFRFVSRPMCEVTGMPFSVDLGTGLVSPEAIANPPSYDVMRSVALHDRIARQLVSSLKYSDHTELAPWMARLMAGAGRELLEKSEIVTSVPLHGWRLFFRRYNQSAELARHIALLARLPFDPVLVRRVRKTRQQVGLNAKARERNVRGAFQVPAERKMEIKGRSVLLVDDVYTTGATVNAVTRALKRVGARQVCVLTFSRVCADDI